MFRNSQRSTGCDAGSVETPTMVATCDDADDVDPTVTSLAFPFGDWAAVVRRLRLALFAGLALCLVSCGQRDLETAQPTSNAADASIASRDAQQAGQGTSGTDLGHLQLREFRPDLQQEFELIDPQKDGWETERFSDLVSIELRKLKQMIAGEKNDLPALDKTFQCTALRPNSMVIRRGIPQRQELRRGPEGLRAAIREAIAALPAQALIDSEAKIIEVQLDGAGGTTRVRVQINARGDTQTMQQTAEWLCRVNGNGTQTRKSPCARSKSCRTKRLPSWRALRRHCSRTGPKQSLVMIRRSAISSCTGSIIGASGSIGVSVPISLALMGWLSATSTETAWRIFSCAKQVACRTACSSSRPMERRSISRGRRV
jgi:hypothetical protein